jgi:F0F1-type ATP synthase assembly protein I
MALVQMLELMVALLIAGISTRVVGLRSIVGIILACLLQIQVVGSRQLTSTKNAASLAVETELLKVLRNVILMVLDLKTSCLIRILRLQMDL